MMSRLQNISYNVVIAIFLIWKILIQLKSIDLYQRMPVIFDDSLLNDFVAVTF